jgi:hypothetical protein
MTIDRNLLKAFCVTAAFAILAQSPARAAQPLSQEPEAGQLRLGQRVKVDDGTCPAGQIKEVSGTKMTPTGVIPGRKCVPRVGPKQK